MFLVYEVSITIDGLVSDDPLCALDPTDFPDWYEPFMYAIAGGLVLITISLVLKLAFATPRSSELIPCYVNLSIVSMASTAAILSAVMGKFCVDSFK
jgi:hypothetical protein